MEDSAKRKERLQAMRMEASSSSGGPSPSFSTTNTPLSNPLIHPAGLVNENSPPSHRFDYYTDPAAAYSAVKRKTSNSGSGGGHGGHFQPSNVSSPVSAARPIAGQMEYHKLSNHSHAREFPSPSPSFYATPLPRSQSGSWRSPVQYPSPTSGNSRTHNFSRPWNMSGNSSGHSYYSNSSQGPLSSFRLGESPMSSAYSDVRGSPHSHSSGRGWQYRGGSPSPGWSGGRGRGGFHNKGYGLGRQLDSFYVKSMVKDPWRKLKPVIGNILVPLSGPQSWLPKSITAKKVKVAENAIDIKPKQNLAEFLAAAFEETISNEQEGEGSIVPYTNDQSGRAG